MDVKGGSDSLVPMLESLRGPLTGYCYRILGSSSEVDDAVQETMMRALRAIESYDPDRAALSTWVHKIATNVCLDMIRSAQRRALPWDLGPASNGNPDIGAPLPAARWVEPMADSRLIGTADPASVALRHETLRLAFITALQWLPPRQRAVLVLRDVLGFTAAEAAEVMETSVAAANSALQRARATLEQHRPRPADTPEPDDVTQRDLLERYVKAFQTHDVHELVAVLAHDARSGMPPFLWWLDGSAPIAAAVSMSDACADDRLVPGGRANGCWTLGQYRPDANGVLTPFALLVLELRDGRISEIVTFLGWGDRFAEFGLPERLEDRR
ncbi:sigma-70 family RNA polymerase sigma factor [Nonomuraea monospora]|uniref:Sigma-70 family RNA polymerase sigma factor n=1 Tax=Nonomuraea monospora TaxID=568818 RepID=A0ABP5PAZ9_9ACTN